MYRHTQNGTLLVALLGAAVLVTLLILGAVPAAPDEEGGRWVAGLTAVILVTVAFLFRSLTITVGNGVLSWSFGPGLIRKSVRLANIERVVPTRTSPLAGWGIHWTGRGWLYNVAGRGAIEVQMKDGRRFLLGTDEPGRLARAVEDGLTTVKV